jgi:hypothetical protein
MDTMSENKNIQKTYRANNGPDSVVKSYVIKTSKSGHKIPVINDVHIHSIYNPLKEAENFISANEKLLKSNNSVLLLGLGFGYHLNLIAKVLRQHHKTNYKIVVIEPFSKIVEDCKKYTNTDFSNVEVYSEGPIDEIYKNNKVIHFLTNRPSVLAHPASFNLYKDYFKHFLTYKAPNAIKDYINTIHSSDLRHYLGQLNVDHSLEEFVNIELSGNRSPEDHNYYFFKALKHIV